MTPLINPAPLDRFSDKPDLIRKLIEIFLETAPAMVEKISAGVANGDTEQVAFHAHSLKGTASELGAARLAETALQIQVMTKAGHGEPIAPLAKELSRCYEETSAALQALVFN